MNIKQYEKKVNSNKNRNTRFVKIRTAHQCNNCKKVINSGTKCLTTNRKNNGRHWYCMSCVKLMLQYKAQQSDGINRNCHWYKCIISTLQDYNNLPYDDEGGAMADLEALSEYEGHCLDCGKCNFAEMLYN